MLWLLTRPWNAAGTATGDLLEAHLTHEIVLAAQELPLPHPDPADRFLGTTAKVLGLTLVTGNFYQAQQALVGLPKEEKCRRGNI
ncbi:MAG TPA: hypothetical protein VL177_03250 [Terriglobales bacterium]|nr:hypothetical protein [Terriglobales bacterium]